MVLFCHSPFGDSFTGYKNAWLKDFQSYFSSISWYLMCWCRIWCLSNFTSSVGNLLKNVTPFTPCLILYFWCSDSFFFFHLPECDFPIHFPYSLKMCVRQLWSILLCCLAMCVLTLEYPPVLSGNVCASALEYSPVLSGNVCTNFGISSCVVWQCVY